MPKPNSVESLAHQAVRKFSDAGLPNPRLDSYLLLASVCERSREWVLAHPEYILSDSQQQRLRHYISQRLDGLSVAAITGSKEFYGLDFIVTPDVLIPRAETETIVELACKHTPQKGRVIDIGTGCGAIAISIKHHRPDLEVEATEISPNALMVAKQNVGRHKTEVFLHEGDLFASAQPSFQTITANLPYLSHDKSHELLPEAKNEPAIALFGGTGDGLDLYRRFFTLVGSFIAPRGNIFIESDPWQHPTLVQLADMAGLELMSEHYFVLGFVATGREVHPT